MKQEITADNIKGAAGDGIFIIPQTFRLYAFKDCHFNLLQQTGFDDEDDNFSVCQDYEFLNKDLSCFIVPDYVREKVLFAEQQKRASHDEVSFEDMMYKHKDNTYQH